MSKVKRISNKKGGDDDDDDNVAGWYFKRIGVTLLTPLGFVAFTSVQHIFHDEHEGAIWKTLLYFFNITFNDQF